MGESVLYRFCLGIHEFYTIDTLRLEFAGEDIHMGLRLGVCPMCGEDSMVNTRAEYDTWVGNGGVDAIDATELDLLGLV